MLDVCKIAKETGSILNYLNKEVKLIVDFFFPLWYNGYSGRGDRMKYPIGKEFILKTSLGDKVTKVVNIKYEFADYIKGGPKYVSEDELAAYMAAGILREDENLNQSTTISNDLLDRVTEYLSMLDGEVAQSLSEELSKEMNG